MRNANILVIEDDMEINDLISESLKLEGYTADSVYDGKEAVLKYSSKSYQLVLLDLMLPQMDGTEVLRRIREKGNTPVIIISAKSDQTDKILGLGLGADDYITKPFIVGELLARVNAQLRRYLYFSDPVPEENVVSRDGLELDLNSYEIKRRGESIPLTSKEYDLLKLFMSYPNKVFTKTQLFHSVWKEDYMSDENTVMVHISRLRTKIEEDPASPKYIRTVWGIGYKFGEIGK